MTQLTSSRTGPATRIARIAEALRRQITSGAFPSGAALPSERVVAEQHAVSRMTARRALEALEAEGLAYSEGRRGRFVSPRRVSYDVSQMVSFVADAQATGRDLSIEVIEMATRPAPPRIADILCIPEGSGVHIYTRLFRIDGHAAFLETEYVSAAAFPDLLEHDLRQSTTGLLEQNFGARVGTGEITIRMRAMSEDEAHHLDQSTSRAGLELEQIVLEEGGKPFCFGRQIWRGEMAEFSARAMVNPTPNAHAQPASEKDHEMPHRE